MAAHQANNGDRRYFYHRYTYSRRRYRTPHRAIFEDQLPPPPPLTPEIFSHKPEMLDDEIEEDMEGKEKVYVEEDVEKKGKKKVYVEEDVDKNDNGHEEEQDGDSKCVCTKRRRVKNKSRKAVLKLGLQPISGVQQVTVKKDENTVLVVSIPEVFENQISGSYVIFGKTIKAISSQQLTQD